MSPAIVFAFTLGLIAAINPCGFPLLPAYLALFLPRADGTAPRSRTVSALAAGGSVSAGFIITFCCIGILVKLGMLAVFGWTLWLSAAVGLGLVLFGALGLAGRAPTLTLRAPRFASGRSAAAMGGFGVAYAVSSLSCALPLFLAAVSSSLTRYGVVEGVAAFLSYALGMGVFITGASVVAAHVGAGSIRRLRPLTRFVPIFANVIVMIVGLYLAATSILGLTSPFATPAVISVIDAVQNSVSQWLAASALVVGGVLLVVVLAAIGLLVGTASRAHRAKEKHA